MSVILGLDPGSQIAGYAVIQNMGDRSKVLKSGYIQLPAKKPLPDRLFELHERLNDIYKVYQPTEVAIEKIFFGKNVDSAFKLGHVRGVCMMQAHKHGALVAEYAARRIKKVVTGSGAATKEHMQYVVGQIIGKTLTGPFDEADAIAIALCHIQEESTAQKLRRTLESQL